MTHYQLGFIALVVLCLCAIHFAKLYGRKSLLYPGMFFCILWFFTIGCSLIVDYVGGENATVFPEYMRELLRFVLVTAVSFFAASFWGYKTIRKNNPQLNLPGMDVLYQYAAVLCLVLSIIHFFVTGGSLNLARMRAIMVEHETDMFYNETRQTMLSTLLGFSNMFNWMLEIYAGMLLARRWSESAKEKKEMSVWLLLCPLLTCISNALTVGGRAGLIFGLRLYFFGIVLSLCTQGFSKEVIKKIVRVTLIVLLFFTLYSNYNSIQRYEETGKEIRTEVRDIPVLGSFFSIINYLSSSTFGYQLRRNDYVTPQLDYGIKTFGGIIFWTIPFSGIIGKPLSPGDLLGLERGYSMKQMFLELQKEKVEYFSVVATIYMTMYDDFGFYGTIIATIIMVLITQWFFFQWFSRDHNNMFSTYFLLLFFWMWSNSIFDSVFVSGYAKQFLNLMIALEIMRFYINSSMGRKQLKEAGKTVNREFDQKYSLTTDS